MALSEREQRLLEEMERNLYDNEADVVTTLGVRPVPNFRAIVIGAVVAIVGVITMITGVSQDITILGILGFVVLFSGVMVAVAIPGKPLETPAKNGSAQNTPRGKGNFMDQLNDRWERRTNRDQQ